MVVLSATVADWVRVLVRRVVRDTTSIQRGIIRHLYLVIDLSMAMLVREFKATWLDIAIQYAKVRPPCLASLPPLIDLPNARAAVIRDSHES